MKKPSVALFLQVYNEKGTGHLERYLKWNLELCDFLCVFDDGSDDGTFEMLGGTADVLVRRSLNSFGDEQISRQVLLNRLREEIPECSHILWLDADEVLFASRDELDSLLELMDVESFGGLRLRHLNLWRSNQHVRLDSGYAGMRPVRIWKNSGDLIFSVNRGLHQQMHPRNLGRIGSTELYPVVHYGFASDELIIQKYRHYRNYGQGGWPLHRLINETGLDTAAISSYIGVLGSRYPHLDSVDSLRTLVPLSRTDWEVKANPPSTADSYSAQPLVSVITLIYSGIEWLEFIYGELIRLQASLSPRRVEVLVIANDPSIEVVDFLKQNHIPHKVVRSSIAHSGEWFINSVYRAYNFGVLSSSGEYVLLVNSDMAFSDGFLPRILEFRDPKYLLAGRLVELGVMKSGMHGIERCFGWTPRSFARRPFQTFVRKILHGERNSPSRLKDGGLFMPLLVHREEFLDTGGFPPGNVPVDELKSYLDSGVLHRTARYGEQCVPGDKAYFIRRQILGSYHKTDFHALSYHFQSGETRKSRKTIVPSGIAIVNQSIDGINGEEVLWRALGDRLQGLGVRVVFIDGGRHTSAVATMFRFRSQLRKLDVPPRLIFSNASFTLPMPRRYRRVVMRQDDPSPLRQRTLQRLVRSTADLVVANDPDFVGQKTRENRIWCPVPLSQVWSVPALPPRVTRRAIFVGAFNSTKGWPEIRDLVMSDKSIYWTLVSKYPSDQHGLGSDEGENWEVHRKIDQRQLLQLMDKNSVFVLASPYETQCLAALEAASRNLAVVMKRTGFLGKLELSSQQLVGEFGSDFENLVQVALWRLERGEFQPRVVVEELGLIGESRYSKWEDVLLNELRASFTGDQPRIRVFRDFLQLLMVRPVWGPAKYTIRLVLTIARRLRRSRSLRD